MVRRGPADDDGATIVFRPVVDGHRRPADDDTTVLPAYGRRHDLQDDTPTEVFAPIRPHTNPPRTATTRPAARTVTPPVEPGRRRRPPAKPKASRKRRIFRTLAVILVLVLAGVGGAAYGLQQQLAGNIERFGIGNIGGDRPKVVAPPEALNVLLVGSDSRTSKGDAGNWVKNEQRTDSMMVVHVAADRKSVDVVSIPRDSWVEIPGIGPSKINAAYAEGGPPLLIQTIEQLTGVRIDHMGIVDFTGFKEMTDALGGVKITVPVATQDSRNFFPAGTYRMNGKQALGYVRQRHGLPNGDFDRMKRQQNWIRAVLKEAMSKGTLTDPLKLNKFLQAATKATALDDGWGINDIRGLALSLTSLKTTDIRFITTPNLGSDWEGDQSIVRLDDVKGPSLWAAIANDQVTDWLTVNKPDLLGAKVR
jgi:LCP family protein required for cell wall assembly